MMTYSMTRGVKMDMTIFMIMMITKHGDTGSLVSVLARDPQGDSRTVLALGVGLKKINVGGAVTHIKTGNA